MSIPEHIAALLQAALIEMTSLDYDKLVSRIGDPQQEFVRVGDETYQLETDVIWDNRPHGTLRLVASIDRHGAFGAWMPYTMSDLVEKAARLGDEESPNSQGP